MQVLFSFFEKIFTGSCWIPYGQNVPSPPLQRSLFKRKQGTVPKNETIPCFMIHLFVSAAAAQLDPQGTSQEGRRIEPTAKANKHSKRKVPNRLPTKQEDGNDGKKGRRRRIDGTVHRLPD